MCGITGFVGFKNYNLDEVNNIAKAMGDAITHRGPNDCGLWVSNNKTEVVLVHRRLSILDVSDAGHQPMLSKSGRYIIVFNGEIYNQLQLRDELELIDKSLKWKGRSDTETLLQAIEEWGFEQALIKLVGMFAIAVLDKQLNQLYLARDRLGEKPLYYGWQAGVFLFGSELKALKVHPSFSGEIDRKSIVNQFRFGYIPAPHSIYKNIFKLLPATFIKIDLLSKTLSEVINYWDFQKIADDNQKNNNISDVEAINSLEGLLFQSIRGQMQSDVHLGAFLSGGVDSSLIASLMQAQSMSPIKTFTIGFEEEKYNEAIYAKDIARHLGTCHIELYLSARDALDVIPSLSNIYDEPFSDSSQIPMYLLSKLAKESVTVSLTGDGGDELFGGYNRYLFTNAYWKTISNLPLYLRKLITRILMLGSSAQWEWIDENLPLRKLSNINLSSRIEKFSAALSADCTSNLYKGFVSNLKNPELFVLGQPEGPNNNIDNSFFLLNSAFEQMMALDTKTYLPDDILVKVDRAAMALSLETRVPLLDHRIVEYAWTLPSTMKIRNGEGKWILRQILNKYVPSKLIDRPKMGFGVPIGNWLRGPLREWAEELLCEPRLHRDQFLNVKLIRNMWAEHLSERKNWQDPLWNILMFQGWLDKNG